MIDRIRSKSQTNSKTARKSLWERPELDDLKFQFSIADSVLKEFVLGHDPSDVLKELAQNEYDAQGSKIEVAFGPQMLTVTGNGIPIDSAGWERLSVMMGTGSVAGSDRNIPQKLNGIGSKNFGLRSLFVYGDNLYIRSGGRQTVLDLSRGALPKPIQDSGSRNQRGVQIHIPYRLKLAGGLPSFDAGRESLTLDGLVHGLTPILIKLARPESSSSLEEIRITSTRLDRLIIWKQDAQETTSSQKGLTVLQRKVRITEKGSLKGSSPRKTSALREIEFQKNFRRPEEFRGQPIPGYFKSQGGRITIALSFRLTKGKIDPSEPGIFFYPIGLSQGYTGCAISVSAPFQLDSDRSHIIDQSNSPWNDWLLETAAAFTLDLLVSDWFDRFGADAYLALEEKDGAINEGYMERIKVSVHLSSARGCQGGLTLTFQILYRGTHLYSKCPHLSAMYIIWRISWKSAEDEQRQVP